METSQLEKDIASSLDDKAVLKDLKTKSEIAKLKKTEESGIVKDASSFDLKHFKEALDNQGRRDALLDVLKKKDEQKRLLEDSLLDFKSKNQQLKETIELQKRYYQLVPRPKISSNKYLIDRPVRGGSMPAGMIRDSREWLDKTNRAHHIIEKRKSSTEFTDQLPGRLADAGRDIRLALSVARDPVTSMPWKDHVVNLNNYPWLFVKTKPTEANLDISLTEEKYIENLNKVQITQNKEREAEGFRAYKSLDNILIDDESLTNNIKSQLNEKYNSKCKQIVNEYYNAVIQFISKIDVLIPIQLKDIDISKYIDNINLCKPKWDGHLSTNDYFNNVISDLIRKTAGTAGRWHPTNANKDNYMLALNILRSSNPIFSDYASSGRDANRQLSALRNFESKIMPSDLVISPDPDPGGNVYNFMNSLPADGDHNLLFDYLKKADTNTKGWIKEINNIRDNFRDKWNKLEKSYDEDVSRYKDKHKGVSNITKERHSEKLCKIMMGNLYAAVFFTPKSFQDYDKYREQTEKVYPSPMWPGNLVRPELAESDTPSLIVDASLYSKWRDRPGQPGFGSIQDFLINYFTWVINNRKRLYPNEYKLFPADIQCLCNIKSIYWSPFIDIQLLIDSLKDDFANDWLTIKDYYSHIDPICYEYLYRVLPILSIEATYDIWNNTCLPCGITIKQQDMPNKPIPNSFTFPISKENSKTLLPDFYLSIKERSVPGLELSSNTFGIEGLVNLKAFCKKSYWTKITGLNEINYGRENTAFHFIEEKLNLLNISKKYYLNKLTLDEMDKTINLMNDSIKERDIFTQKDSLVEQLELGLDSFQFWKKSEDSKIEVYNILKEFNIQKFFSPLDRLNFATVGKFLQLENSELFSSITKDFEMIERDKVLMRLAIKKLKDNIEKSKTDSKDKLKKDTSHKDIFSLDKSGQITESTSEATSGATIDKQEDEIQRNLQEMEIDDKEIESLKHKNEEFIQRNKILSDFLNESRVALLKIKSNKIEIDEKISEEIHRKFHNARREIEINQSTMNDIFEIMKRKQEIKDMKLKKFLKKHNYLLQQSLNEAHSKIREFTEINDARQYNSLIQQKETELSSLNIQQHNDYQDYLKQRANIHDNLPISKVKRTPRKRTKKKTPRTTN